MENVVFVTGTDTGVGKTLLTALLLAHLRDQGCAAAALKPFCSGSRSDVRALQAFQPGEMTDEEVNPWFCAPPLAPAMAADGGRPGPRISEVVRHVSRAAARCERLLVEGVGGVMVPLAGRWVVGDLIGRLQCAVVVVGRNRLGTINHTLLTVGDLKRRGIRGIRVVLMGEAVGDRSAATNARAVEEWGGVRVERLPFLRGGRDVTALVRGNYKKLKKVLARILV